MAASAIPIISAVGHEVDFTIADLCGRLAGLHALGGGGNPGPASGGNGNGSGGFRDRLEWLLAQKVSRLQEKLFHLRKRLADPRRRWVEVSLRLDDYAVRLRLALTGSLQQKANRLGWTGERLFGLSPRENINVRTAQLDTLRIQLQGHPRQLLHRWGLEMKRAENTLRALSPWAVLSRGYALARTLPEMQVIRKVDHLRPGQAIRVQVAQGEMNCRVEEVLTKNI